MADEHFSLLLAFDTDDPEFVRGVEVGRLWEMLKTGEEINQTIHSTNTEMAIRICEAGHRDFKAMELDAVWTELTVEVGAIPPEDV